MLSNFERMLQLIDEVFATRQDKNQLQVNDKVIAQLQKIHAATLSEISDGNGPLSWVLIIPTTREVMNDFISGRITEKELLARTRPGQDFRSIYLCSATTLPEHRGKGATRQLCLSAIDAICRDHPIETLYVWPFTLEGEHLAESLAKAARLELVKVLKK